MRSILSVAVAMKSESDETGWVCGAGAGAVGLGVGLVGAITGVRE